MVDNINKLANFGRRASIAAATGIGVAKVIEAAGEISEKTKEKRIATVSIIGSLMGLAAILVILCQYLKQKGESARYRAERMADADAEILKAEAKARYEKSTTHKVAVINPCDEMEVSERTGDVITDSTNDSVSWFEYYHEKFPIMPFDLPPIISDYLVGCPAGFEEAVIAQLTTTLGAVCCSRVQAKYHTGHFKRPNLQTIIEAPSGSGKSIFENIHKNLLARRIDTDNENFMEFREKQPIMQTISMTASAPMLIDILAFNKGVHAVAFEPEIKTVAEAMRTSNGISMDLLCKAFDNSSVTRMNKDKSAPQGEFQVCLNYVFTGTPDAVERYINRSKGIEGGNAARICWCVLPPREKELPKMDFPDEEVMENIYDEIDRMAKQYSYSIDDNGVFVPADMVTVNLDYVNDELRKWLDSQYELAIAEENKERDTQRGRFATMAFQCAIVYHILYGCPTDADDRKKVTQLTLYMANYFIERYLHKFGHVQNLNHAKFEAKELVTTDRGNKATENPGEPSSSLITDIPTLKAMHDVKDYRGQNKNGWDYLSKISGIPESTLRRKIKEYENSLQAEKINDIQSERQDSD